MFLVCNNQRLIIKIDKGVSSMKETYVRAEMEIIEFESEDIIVTSGGEDLTDLALFGINEQILYKIKMIMK